MFKYKKKYNYWVMYRWIDFYGYWESVFVCTTKEQAKDLKKHLNNGGHIVSSGNILII